MIIEGVAEETGRSAPEDLHARLVGWIEDAESQGDAARTRSERDRDYYDGRQITDD